MSLRGIPEPPDIVGHDARDESGCRIGKEALRPADVIRPARRLRCPPILINEDGDSVLVFQFDRLAIWESVAKDRVRGQLAYANCVGAQEISEFFDVAS